ncbi:MAG: hypothetical protein LBM75_05140 [Myxococcales bacterium]|jgi:vacuolar-type H+-ATPase subunit H|nr:hypothetical protein [Myxococcales bacterium]
MKPLPAILTDPARRPKVLDDCVDLLNAEVESKSGLTGIAIKGAYAVVKAVKPGFVRIAFDDMLEDFSKRLDPFFQKAHADAQPVAASMTARASEAADALLGITDERATRAKNTAVKKAYDKLRPMAKKHVEAAIPRVSQMIEKNTADIQDDE